MSAAATIDKDNQALADRIRKALEEAGITPAEIARRLGVTPQAVNSWFNTGTISKQKLRELARETGKPLAWFVSDDQDPPQTADGGRYVYIARYKAVAGLGNGRHNEQHVEISGTHAYRRDWIQRNGWRPETLAVVEAEGPSMAPTINDGDVVLVNLEDQVIKSGEVYAIEDPDEGTRIKRLHRTLDGRVRVVSDNPDKRLYPDDYLTPDSGARVIGRVVHRSGSV